MRFSTTTLLAAAIAVVGANPTRVIENPAAQITPAPKLTPLEERGIFSFSEKTKAWKHFTSEVGHDAKKVGSELYSVFTNFGGHNDGNW